MVINLSSLTNYHMFTSPLYGILISRMGEKTTSLRDKGGRVKWRGAIEGGGRGSGSLKTVVIRLEVDKE